MVLSPKRRWFQFSLRTLLVLTTVLGFGLGYVAYQRELAKRYQRMEADLAKKRFRLAGGESGRPDWLKAILGDDSAGKAYLVSVGLRHRTGFDGPKDVDRCVAELQQLPYLTDLIFEDKRIGDEGLRDYRALTQLQAVHLQELPVTIAGLRELRDIRSLRQLNLMGTPTDDGGLREIASHHPNLESLWLWGDQNHRCWASGTPAAKKTQVA